MLDVVEMDPEKKAKLRGDVDALEETCAGTSSKLDLLIRSAKKHTMFIEGFGFDIEVYRAMPGPLKEMAADEFNSKEELEPIDQYKKEVEISSKVLATMCVEPDFQNVDAWLMFERETGLLRDLTAVVIEETCARPEEVKNFRRKPAGSNPVRSV